MISTANSGLHRYLKPLAHLGAFLTVVAWGTSFISTKVLMEDAGLTPIEVYIYRFILAYLILLALTFKKIWANNWKDELQFMLCGICCGSLYYVLENYALLYTTTGNVSLLSSVSPLITTALTVLVFRTKVGAGVIIGSAIAFAGVACVIFSHGEGFELNPLGDLLALSTALSWAIYAIGIKRLVPSYSTLFVTRKLFLYGVVSAVPFLMIQAEPYHLEMILSPAHLEYMLNFVFLVGFCSIGGFLVWNESIRILGPVAANNYLYLQPLVTMVVAYFVFDEKIFMLGYIGCILIIGGLIIADKLKLKSSE